ncbi:hypothetical protein AVEN_150006-1 [Araneus ventricosus]|uniref:Uncharacterized protein n=1 Tax=Araneus ventricosus TaxID=182803 RepID=A0A4Y2HRC4_ARAVE|nr:hypothetical protein AVEN_150006-1 [Araneus ventricosus]
MLFSLPSDVCRTISFMIKIRSVTLTSRFEATPRLLREYLVNLNHGQMTGRKPELTPSFPSFRAASAGGRSATASDLACGYAHTRRILGGVGFRARDFATRPSLPL